MTRNSRKRIFVDWSVQGALVKRIMIHWCVFFALASLSLIALELFVLDPNMSFDERLAAVWGKYDLFFLLMLAVIPSFVYDTIKLSHRFAGPISRLKTSLNRLADGQEVEELKFRNADYWTEIADDFNRVSARITKMQQTIDSIESNETDRLNEEPDMVGCEQ